MKFERHFQYGMKAEWRQYYLPYATLKGYIKRLSTRMQQLCARRRSNKSSYANGSVTEPLLYTDTYFVQQVHSELDTFMLLFKEHLAQIESLYVCVENQLVERCNHLLRKDGPSRKASSRRTHSKTMDIKAFRVNVDNDALKPSAEAFRLFYKDVATLKSFVTLNFTAICKIRKKLEICLRLSSKKNINKSSKSRHSLRVSADGDPIHATTVSNHTGNHSLPSVSRRMKIVNSPPSGPITSPTHQNMNGLQLLGHQTSFRAFHRRFHDLLGAYRFCGSQTLDKLLLNVEREYAVLYHNGVQKAAVHDLQRYDEPKVCCTALSLSLSVVAFRCHLYYDCCSLFCFVLFCFFFARLLLDRSTSTNFGVHFVLV